MKLNTVKTIFALLLITVGATAQTIEVNTTDKQTGNRTILTSNNKGGNFNMDDSVAKGDALFFATGYQSTNAKGKVIDTYFIDLSMIHNDNRLGCIKQHTGKAILILKDGSEMECYQISDTDCDPTNFKGAYALKPQGGSMALMQENLNKLMTTDICKIKVVTTERPLIYKIPVSQREYLKNHFILIDKTVKKETK